MNKDIAYIPCNSANYGGRRDKSAIKYLVYHYTGNDGDRAANNAVYFRDNVVQASAHYFVDDESIIRSVEDLRVAWAVGGKKWADCGQTGGGAMYGIVTNTNSLSIEMCDTRRDGVYNVTEETMENALELGRMLMDQYGIPIENVYRHFDVTGKHCPQYFMDNSRWAAFKARLVQKEEDNMTGKEIYEELNKYLKAQALPGWAKAELDEAVKLGITDGSDPMALIPRYQAAIMAKRAAERKPGL